MSQGNQGSTVLYFTDEVKGLNDENHTTTVH